MRASFQGSRKRAEAFLSVFKPVFERYEEALSSSGEIDFNDMINRAADHVKAGRWSSPYGYILIDEFSGHLAGTGSVAEGASGQQARLAAAGRGG